jgi:hypothetical protein
MCIRFTSRKFYINEDKERHISIYYSWCLYSLAGENECLKSKFDAFLTRTIYVPSPYVF